MAALLVIAGLMLDELASEIQFGEQVHFDNASAKNKIITYEYLSYIIMYSVCAWLRVLSSHTGKAYTSQIHWIALIS